MYRSQYDLWMDERSAAYEDVVYFARRSGKSWSQYCHHPGKFSVLGFVVLEIGDANVHAVRVAQSAQRQMGGLFDGRDLHRRLDHRRLTADFDRSWTISPDQRLGIDIVNFFHILNVFCRCRC